MNKLTLTAEARTRVKNSKGENYRLRTTGKIPAVIYGTKKPVSIAVSELEFNQKFKVISENVIVTLAVGKDSYEVLVKDYQEDLIANRIIHLDFYEIDQNRALRTRVPVYLFGNPVGVKEGGILEHLMHEVDVECLPKNMPEKIELDTSELNIHNSIHVRDLKPIEGVRFTDSGDQVICHVVPKSAEIEEAAKPEAAAVAVEGEAAAPAAAEGAAPAAAAATPEKKAPEKKAEKKADKKGE